MKWVIAYAVCLALAYAVCLALACFILWLRQGKFLAADVRVRGAIMLGPLSLLIALFVPRSMLTSREEQEAKPATERSQEKKQMTSSSPMPEYRSHKRVWALQISEVADSGTDSTADENQIVTVSFIRPDFPPRTFNLAHLPVPKPGWFLVKYENNYESFSPPDAFIEGNSPRRYIEDSKTPIIRYFAYSHLPSHLSKVSQPLCELALELDATLPDGPEKSAGLRKLLEAKDCLVRAAL